MSKNTTTLYIGDTSIRLMVTRGRRITKLADVPLDISLSDIDTEEKQTELVNKIKLLFKTNHIRSKKVILGISGLQCLTRPVNLPDLPKAMLGEAVMREARRVLPVAPEQLYISWQTLSVSEGKIQAFMVAIPRQVADTLLNMLNRSGFKPYLMDIKPLALARLSKESTAIIVDVQSSEFDIVVLVNGIPQPIRTVPFQQNSLSLEEKMVTVTDELKRTIQFHNQNNPDVQLKADSTLYVSGELAEEPETYESLSREVNCKVALLSSPLKCAKHLDPSHHLANIGLALKEVTKETGRLLPNFNTLPSPYQPKQVSLNRLIALPTAAVAVGSIILLFLTIQNAAAKIDDTSNQVDSANLILEKKQAQKKELTANIASLQQQLGSFQATRDGYTIALNNFKVNGDNIDNDLLASVNNVVDGLEVKSITRSISGLGLTGTANSETEVFKYARNLTATGRFLEVTIANISQSESESESESSENETITSVSYSLALKLEALAK